MAFKLLTKKVCISLKTNLWSLILVQHYARKTHDLHKFRIDIGNVNALEYFILILSRTTIHIETFDCYQVM